MATYSFLDVKCAMVGPGGSVNLGNGAGDSEEGITIVPSVDINNMEIAADSKGQHSLIANLSGTITISVLKTSDVNKVLSVMYNLQTASSANHGQNTISLTLSTGESITCEQVAFKRITDLGYKTVAGFNEWQFDAIRILRTLGTY